MKKSTPQFKRPLVLLAALTAFAAGAFAETATVDGSEAEVSISTNDDGTYDISSLDLSDTAVFADGEDGAYLVTLGDSTYLVGDTTLKRWAGNWESWQPYIYPDSELLAEYPYLEYVWDLAYEAYVAVFAAYGYDVTSTYPNTDALKAYWHEMTYTNGVAKIKVVDDDSYTLYWLGEEGDTLASGSYSMTGKVVNGLEGANMYVFTAAALPDTSAYKYFVSMEPDMEGTDETPIAAHYHFQFGNDRDSLLLYGELYNSTTKNIADKYWYATMINEDASALAKYNVILGMHQAEKWSELPSEENSDDDETSSDSSSDSDSSDSSDSESDSSSDSESSGDSDDSSDSSSDSDNFSDSSSDSDSSSSSGTSAIASLKAASSKLYSEGSSIVVRSSSARKAKVYSLSGRLIAAKELVKGETRISSLQGGVYVVKLSDGTVGKVKLASK